MQITPVQTPAQSQPIESLADLCRSRFYQQMQAVTQMGQTCPCDRLPQADNLFQSVFDQLL